MEKNTTPRESIKIVASLLRYKWFIILFTLVLTIGSVIYALYVPVQFKSTVNAVPPSNTGSDGLGGALGNISSKLKDFGITKLAGGAGGGQSYDLSVLMESRTVADSMINKFNLAEAYEIPDTNMDLVRKAFRGNVELMNYREGNFEISIWDESPVKAAKMANTFIELVNQKALDINKKETKANIEYLEDRIESTERSLAKIQDSLTKYSRIHRIYAPEEQATAFSKSLAELQALVMQSEVEYNLAKNKYGESDPITIYQKEMYNETKEQLRKAKNQPGFMGNFSMDDISSVGIEYMRLSSEFEAFSKLKLFLMPSLEKSKLDLLNNNNFLYVVDEAIPADKKDRPKRSLIVMGTMLGAFILSVIIVFLITTYKGIKTEYQELLNS